MLNARNPDGNSIYTGRFSMSPANCEFLLAFGIESLKRQSSRSLDYNDLDDLIAAEDKVALENL